MGTVEFGGRKAVIAAFKPRPSRAGYLLSSVSVLVLALSGSVAPSGSALAADWNGTVSDDWFTAGNWSAGAVPTAGTVVNIDTTTPNSTVINGATASSSQIFVGNGPSSTGALTISGGGALVSSAGAYIAYGLNSVATATVTGAGSTLSGGIEMSVGMNGTGTLNILNGGAVTDTVGSIGWDQNASGTATVDGAGSTWANSSNLIVGQNGAATLNIQNHGTVTSPIGILGFNAGSTNNVVTVDGVGASWANGVSLTVGNFGGGAVNVENGGTLSSGAGYLGLFSGSSGAVVVDGAGSTWAAGADLDVGVLGTGVLTVSDGGVVTGGAGYVGFQAGGTGTVTITGAGSAWNNTLALTVGGSGTGTLNVLNGGTVSSTVGYLGNNAGATGTVIVDGAGSTWNTSGLAIGNGGTGTLLVTGGGTVANGQGVIGSNAGSNGVATVMGTGSSWTNSGDLRIGNFGHGTLNVLNGGSVAVDAGGLGYSAGSTGAATVDGAGSVWTISSLLYVGFGGTGTMDIANGGAVLGIESYLGYEAGSTGAVSVDGAGSSWTNLGDLSIGQSGAGTLAVTNGGVVDSNFGFIGQLAGSTGAVSVSGAGSAWNNLSAIVVGNNGTGSLAISDGGTVTSFAGFIGGNTGIAGTATVDGAGSSWTMAGALTIGNFGIGTLAITNGATVANEMGTLGAGAGSSGTVLVSGAGSSWTSSSDLYVGNDGAGTLTIANGGVVSAAGIGVSLGLGAGSVGTLNIGGAAGSMAEAAGTLDAATLQFGAGAGTINFNHTDANYIFAPAISGLGTLNQIAGTTTLTGNSSGFTGATTISGGTLSVNGGLGGTLSVLSGGTLKGSGTVGAVDIAAGGMVAPGNSIGTLHVNGGVSFAPDSIYAVEIAGNGESDLIAATGQAVLNGGTVEVTALDPQVSYQNGRSYTVLTAQGGVTGSFADAVTASIFLDVELEQHTNSVDITIAVQGDGPTPPGPPGPPSPPAPPAVFTSAAVTPNQFATASALDTLPQSGSSLALYNSLLFLTSATEAQYAFDQLSGEAYASTKGMFIEQSGLIRTAMIDRLRAAFGAVGGATAPVMSYAAPSGPGASAAGKAIDQGMALKAVAAPATTESLALWTSGFGSWGEMDGTINAASLSSSTGGFLIGADAALGAGWRLGVTGGYSYTDVDIDARNSSGDSENWHIGLYGGNQWGPLGLRTGLAYTWHDVDTSRAVGFTGFSDSLSAAYDAGTFQAFGELGYRIDTAFAAFEPFANLAYVSLHTDGFNETGGPAALTGESSTTDATFTTLGLRASTQMMLGSAATTLRGALGWRHAFGGDVVPFATQSFAGSEAFTVSGAPIAEDAALVEAGLDVLIAASATLGVAYTGQFGDDVTQNGFNATLKVSF